MHGVYMKSSQPEIQRDALAYARRSNPVPRREPAHNRPELRLQRSG